MNIIINADDFGISSSVNSAIIDAHENGCLTSTTIIAGGKGFDECICYALRTPSLGYGIHLTLDGPYNILKNNSTLMNSSSGSFYEGKEVIKRILFKKYKHEDLVAEYSAQIEKILNTGVSITHIDHHHHLHLYFPILKAVIEVSKKYGINIVRPQKIILNPSNFYLKNLYRVYHYRYLCKNAKTIDGYFTFATKNSQILYERVSKLLQKKIDTVEIIVHPMLIDDFESKILKSDFFYNFNRVKLINYGDI